MREECVIRDGEERAEKVEDAKERVISVFLGGRG